MGTPIFASEILQKLIDEKHNVACVVTQPDKLVGRKKILTPSPVKEVALKNNMKVLQPAKIRDDYDEIIKMQPDIIITAAYGQFLPKQLLELPKYKSINVHASLLPKYRGGAPIHKAIINGEEETGVTIMYMVEKMDAGDIISQKSTPILDSDNVGIMFEKLASLGANLLIETLPKIFNKTSKALPQDENLATYAKNITRAEEKINWQQDAKKINNHIRGLYPAPSAYTTISNLNVKIYEAEVIEVENDDSECEKICGKIVFANENGIGVQTLGMKMLVIKRLQISGKKEIPLKQLLNGNHPFKIGNIFEN